MAATMTGPSKAEQQKWESEDDLRTMTEATKIKDDGPRMQRIKRLAKMKAAEMQKMAGMMDKGMMDKKK